MRGLFSMRYRTPLRTRLYAASFVILMIGLTAGLVIYLMAEDEAVNLTIYEMTVSKTYLGQLQRFGGRASVVFDEFNRWFAGLWRSKALGATIAWLSAGTSLALILVARRLPDR
jgi:hypothetical protein